MKTTWQDIVWINSFRKYGRAVRIRREWIILFVIILCLVTPFTNWLIPLLRKIIKKDLIWRFD